VHISKTDKNTATNAPKLNLIAFASKVNMPVWYLRLHFRTALASVLDKLLTWSFE